MGLEDIALFGTLPDSVVLQPCDAISTAKLVPQMVAHKGITYMRTLRPKTKILYDDKHKFRIGGCSILRQSNEDVLVIAATGITVFEALKAADELRKENISVGVIDCYSIKPLDRNTITQCVKESKNQILVTVEDHFMHGGLGDFAEDAMEGAGYAVVKMAVEKISQSGTMEELLKDARIDSTSIIAKVKTLVQTGKLQPV
jgi:transketolase